MQTVMNEKLAKWFAENDYFYIMHRFDEKQEYLYKTYAKFRLICIYFSWCKEREFDFIEKLAQEKLIPEYITIDIAHGHQIQ